MNRQGGRYPLSPAVTSPAHLAREEAATRRPPGGRISITVERLRALASSRSPLISSVDLPSKREARALLKDLPRHATPYYVAPYPYRRAYFGEPWADTDGNGRNTRDDILAAQLTDVTYNADGNVLTGNLIDPYTGATHTYSRGLEAADPIVVDHVLSLWEAWATGAWAWTPPQRLEFANDPLNLITTLYSINEDKGPKNAARWHSRHGSSRLELALRIVATKHKYHLEIHDLDRHYLKSALR